MVAIDVNASLCVRFTTDEVKEAVFQIGALKAPGQNGFLGLFYQSY